MIYTHHCFEYRQSTINNLFKRKVWNLKKKMFFENFGKLIASVVIISIAKKVVKKFI